MCEYANDGNWCKKCKLLAGLLCFALETKDFVDWGWCLNEGNRMKVTEVQIIKVLIRIFFTTETNTASFFIIKETDVS